MPGGGLVEVLEISCPIGEVHDLALQTLVPIPHRTLAGSKTLQQTGLTFLPYCCEQVLTADSVGSETEVDSFILKWRQ